MRHFQFFLSRFGEKQLRDSRDNLLKYQYDHYVKLDAYVNDVQGFFPYIEDLKNIFKMKTKELEIANKMVATIRNTYKVLKRNENIDKVIVISIHVRLTDYKRHLKDLFDLEPISRKWFTKAMKYFCDKYQVKLNKTSNYSSIIICKYYAYNYQNSLIVLYFKKNFRT